MVYYLILYQLTWYEFILNSEDEVVFHFFTLFVFALVVEVSSLLENYVPKKNPNFCQTGIQASNITDFHWSVLFQLQKKYHLRSVKKLFMC